MLVPRVSQNPTTAPRRRNGRPQACEPCRKRKVACDHQVPICSRCKSSEIASSCVYSAQDPTKSRRRSIAFIASPQLVGRSERQESNSIQQPYTPLSNDEGYLGVTSYKYAMREAESKMAPELLVDECADLANASDPRQAQSSLMANDRVYDAAMRALRGVPERTLAHDLFSAYVNPNDGWCRLATDQLHCSFWDTFGSYLDGERSTKSLHQLATKLHENSCKALHEAYTDPREWLKSFSGRNMRWEGLGILFTYWAHGAGAIRQGRERDNPISGNSSMYILRYKHCAWDIVDVTRSTASANTILLYLLYTHANLESIISGDDSLQSLRLGGEAMSLMCYLGLHVMTGTLRDRGICSQIKRRLFAKICHGDKTVATFTGWPPVLSQRFVSTPLPLDVSDEMLLGAVPWRDDLIDDEGWNTLGDIYPSTLLRARASLGIVREAILNISLQIRGSMNKPELINLRERQENTISKFPDFLMFEREDIRNPNISGSKLFAKLLIQLEHLQSLFFIERLLNKVENVTLSTRLVQVSLEIVSITLIFWTHKDKMIGLHADYEWLVVQFASPAAGILCLELLRPYSDNMGSELASLSISRSDLIQNLSLLNGFLSWIEPLVPGRKLTGSFVQSVVQRVLDQALNYPMNSTGLDTNAMEWGDEMRIDMSDLSFDLLDTFDWMRSD